MVLGRGVQRRAMRSIGRGAQRSAPLTKRHIETSTVSHGGWQFLGGEKINRMGRKNEEKSPVQKKNEKRNREERTQWDFYIPKF